METFMNNMLDVDDEESNSRNTSLLRSESFEEEMRELQSFAKLEAQCELEEEIGRLRNENKLLHAKYSNIFKLYQINVIQNYQTRIPPDTGYKHTYLQVIQETDELESSSPEMPCLRGSLEDTESVYVTYVCSNKNCFFEKNESFSLDCYNEDCDNVNLDECSVSCCDTFIPKAEEIEEDISDTVFDIKKKLRLLYKILEEPDDNDSGLSLVFQKICKDFQYSKSISIQDLKKKLKYLSSYVENLINKQQDFSETFYNCLNNETENKTLMPLIEECRKKLAESFAIGLNLKVISNDICLKTEHLCRENDRYKELTLTCDTIMELISSETCQSDTMIDKIEKNLETLKQLTGILQDIVNIMNITNKTDFEKSLEDIYNKTFINEKLQNSFTRIFSLAEFIDLNFKDLKVEYLQDFKKLSFLKTFWLKCYKLVKSKDNINEKKQLIAKVTEEFQEEKSSLILEVQKHKTECDLLSKRFESSMKQIDDLITENNTLKELLEKFKSEKKTEEKQHIQKINKELEVLLHEKTLSLKSKEEMIVICTEKIIEETNKKNKINQDYHTALNKIEKLEGELTKSRNTIVQAHEKLTKLEQKTEELKKIQSIKIETLNRELVKLRNNLLLTEKELCQAKKEKDEMYKQNSELKRKNDIISKLQKDMKEVLEEKEHHMKQACILNVKLQNFNSLQNVLISKSEAYNVLLTTLKEESTQEDIIAKIENELKYLENQIKSKREPILLFILKLMDMFNIFKQALVKSHNKITQTQSDKIYNLQYQLAEQKNNYQKKEEESNIKLSSYKKRLGDLENRYKQSWINGPEHFVLHESNQNIWKMKRTAEQDRRRSLGPGIFHSPLLELDNSGESRSKKSENRENQTERQKQLGVPKISLTSNQNPNPECRLTRKDETDSIKETENLQLNKKDEQIYKDKYNIAKEVACMRLRKIKALEVVIEQLRQQAKDEVP